MTEMEFALNTFYLVLSGAFVMWMAAGFTMLEAGLVRSKNVSEIVTKNLGLYSIACVMYLACGFYLMYPGDDVINAYLPGMGTTWGISLAGLTANYDLGYSDAADFFFQVVFVATAMSIVSGAVAERMKLVPFFIFAVVMTGFIYPVQGYWKWGGGWLDAIGYTDFAGSGVVHLCGASAALAAVLILGARAGKYGSDGSVTVMRGSNIPIAALGAFILWLGWFGFNGGSQLASGTLEDVSSVATIYINTNLAAGGGVLAAATVSRVIGGKTDVVMMLNGAIAGLVGITAEPLTPSPLAAIFIGAIAGVLMYFSVKLLFKMKIDDVVGAIPAHLVAGVWGTLAVPLTNSDVTFGAQFLGTISVVVFVFVVSFIVFQAIKSTIGLRISKEAERLGTDKAEVGVIAYGIRD